MAAKVRVVITGLKGVDKKLRTLPLRIQKRVVSQAARAGMKLVATAVRQEIPVDKGIAKANVKVRSGLKRKRSEVSVDVRIEANDQTKKTSKKTGKTVFYPALIELEYGGKEQAPNPFMHRAFVRAGEPARRLTVRLLREGVEREARSS